MNTCALKILAVSKSKSHLVSILATLLVLTLCINTAVAQGVLINGANQTGTINTNILADSYTFTANAGDSINLRLGWTGTQTGNLELFGPNGALLKRTAGSTDDLVTETAATDGTYTVLVSGYDNGGVAIGTYVLNLSQVPEPFIVPAGYGGGPLTNGANATGTITLGRSGPVDVHRQHRGQYQSAVGMDWYPDGQSRTVWAKRGVAETDRRQHG